MKRHPDGRFRGNRSPIKISNRLEIARWVERETVRLKKMGISSFETIADLLTRCGRGQHVPTVVPPDGAPFPPDYSISKMGCWKAYHRRMEREPSLEAREHRKLDTERLEELYLSLQPGIKKGDAKAIDAGVRVISLKARVLGYESPQQKNLGLGGFERRLQLINRHASFLQDGSNRGPLSEHPPTRACDRSLELERWQTPASSCPVGSRADQLRCTAARTAARVL